MRLAPLAVAVAVTACTATTPAPVAKPLPVTKSELRNPSPSILQIAAISKDSSQVPTLAQALFDSLGPRLTGSPGLRNAQDYLLARYAAWGISAQRVEYGSWRSWRRGMTHVDLIAPRVRTLDAIMLAWSPGTSGAPVDADVVVLPPITSAESFRAFLPSISGKFVMISNAPVTCRPDSNWIKSALPGEFERMRDARAHNDSVWAEGLAKTGVAVRDIGDTLERAGAAGVFRNAWTGGWGTDRIFNARTRTIPVIDLGCEDYGLVFRLAANNQHPRVRVAAESWLQGEVPVSNVIATIPGGAKKNEYVMLSAHFDSWDGGSGATDNGTGTVVMLEAMRILKTVLPHPTRTILAGHWSGEEQGLIGSRAYAADHPEVVNGLQALFNQDNGTGRVQSISMQGLTGAAAFFRLWFAAMPDTMTSGIELGVPGQPGRGGTDNASFVCYGAPAFVLSSVPWDYWMYTWHTTRDTYDKLVMPEVQKNATLVAMLAYLASEDAETIPRARAELKDATSAKVVTWPTCTVPIRSSGAYAR